MSILQDIYRDTYTPSKAAEKLPFSLRMERQAFLDAVESSLDREFLDRHMDGLRKLQQFRDYANFREGFRLGVSLMLEML